MLQSNTGLNDLNLCKNRISRRVAEEVLPLSENSSNTANSSHNYVHLVGRGNRTPALETILHDTFEPTEG
jgi:hypothetical protein